MIILAPGTEDPALSGCRLREATSTFPALAGLEYPTWPDGLTRGGAAGPIRKSALAGRRQSAPSRHQVEILYKHLADAEIADLMAIAECADRTEYAEGAGGRLHWPRTWRVLEKEVIRVKECNREGN